MELKEALDRARRQPTHAEAWIKLAEQLERSGRTDEARQSVERAIYLEPTNEEFYELLFKLEQGAELPVWVDELDRELTNGATSPLPTRVALPASRGRAALIAPILVLLVIMGVAGGLLADRGNRATIDAVPGQPPVALVADGQAQTRADAAEPGESVRLANGLEITLVGGRPATDVDEIRFYYDYDGDGEKEFRDDEVPAGLQPYFVQLVVTNESHEEMYIGLLDVALSTAELASFDTDCGIIAEELGGTGVRTLRPGQSAEGNICRLIPADEEPAHVSVDVSSPEDRRFFRLP